MSAAELAIAISMLLFLSMLACLEVGYRVGRRKVEEHPTAHDGIGTIEAAIFALLGLLLGFSFSGATARFDARRQLITAEANAIGTAYLRLDELPAPDQPELRQLFRQYVDARVDAYARIPDMKAFYQGVAQAGKLQHQIWVRAIAACRNDPTQNSARLLLPALNEMSDVTTDRTIAINSHLPWLVFCLLVWVALSSCVVAGYAMAKRRKRSWLHMLLYATCIAITVYTVTDLDYPRSGLIRLSSADKALEQLRDSIR
jgi:Protein of unknown function (DUF4239)